MKILSSHRENNTTHLCFYRKCSDRDFFSTLLEITAFDAPDLNRTVRVAKDGGIRMPLIGTVKAVALMVKGATGAPSWAEFSRLQKQNRELLELVGEITLKLSMTPKNN